MITQSPFGRTGHLSTRRSSARRPCRASPSRSRSHPGSIIAVRRQPHRYRLQLRRRGTAHRPVDEAVPQGVFPGDKNRRTDVSSGQGADPSITGAAPDGSRGPAPISPPGCAGRMGNPDGARRRARSGHRGADAGSGPLHRRDGTRARDCRDASAQPGAVRLRLSAVAVQLSDHAEPAVRGQLRKSGGDLPGTQRSGAGHQGDTAASLGDRAPTRATWYEPLEEQAAIDLAVSYVLGRPGIFLNTVGDINVLPKVLDAASRFERAPSAEEMQALATRLEMSSMFV